MKAREANGVITCGDLCVDGIITRNRAIEKAGVAFILHLIPTSQQHSYLSLQGFLEGFQQSVVQREFSKHGISRLEFCCVATSFVIN